MTEPWLEQLRNLVAQTCERENCRLYDLEFAGVSGRRTLRVFIDKKPESAVSGVGLADCENVSRALNLILDVEDLIPGGAYDLEVSTPGLERTLRLPWHFESAVGKTIKIKLQRPVEAVDGGNPLRNFSGELTGVTPDGISVMSSKKSYQIPFQMIEKANLVFEMNKQKRS